MTLKVIELALIVGALWLLWRSAQRLGRQAAEQRRREADKGRVEPGSGPSGKSDDSA